MPDDTLVILVNLDYPEDEHGHILYQVPTEREQEARQAVEAAYQAWQVPDETRSIEDLIENEFHKINLPVCPLSYEPITLTVF